MEKIVNKHLVFPFKVGWKDCAQAEAASFKGVFRGGSVECPTCVYDGKDLEFGSKKMFYPKNKFRFVGIILDVSNIFLKIFLQCLVD